jgi:hypothetical protein
MVANEGESFHGTIANQNFQPKRINPFDRVVVHIPIEGTSKNLNFVWNGS